MKIARLMPDVDFHCWGKALLEDPPDLSLLPANVKMLAPFKSYEELPLGESDGWLYTSAWDGMPTILIELAYHGVPIAASAVEGVPELIREDTGWPVAQWEQPKAYVVALQEMIASPEKRILRANALQALASEVYSVTKFDRVLKDRQNTIVAPNHKPMKKWCRVGFVFPSRIYLVNFILKQWRWRNSCKKSALQKVSKCMIDRRLQDCS